MNLSGKVAIVTGAARGIGLAIASRFCRAGARVALADLNAADLDKAIETIRRDQPGAQCLGVTVDVGDRATVEAMVEKSVATFGRIDILISNAGVWKNLTRGPFWKLGNAEWQNTFRVNTEGAVRCETCLTPRVSE